MKRRMRAVRFLTMGQVILICQEQLGAFGGIYGILDKSGLESASAMPQSGIGGEYFHKSLFEMAAAYAYHIAMNHPFMDGNKRTALTAALTFLKINSVDVGDPEMKLYDAIVEMVEGRIGKQDFARILEMLADK